MDRAPPSARCRRAPPSGPGDAPLRTAIAVHHVGPSVPPKRSRTPSITPANARTTASGTGRVVRSPTHHGGPWRTARRKRENSDSRLPRAPLHYANGYAHPSNPAWTHLDTTPLRSGFFRLLRMAVDAPGRMEAGL